jgi:hypothetical protein
VRKAFASSVLSLLLLTTLVWGGCISCEQYFMFGGPKSCCSPDGHCKTKKPASPQNARVDCNQIAFDHQKSVDLHIDLPVVSAVQVELPVPAVAQLTRRHATYLAEPSPPDLQVLHSTFLI